MLWMPLWSKLATSNLIVKNKSAQKVLFSEKSSIFETLYFLTVRTYTQFVHKERHITDMSFIGKNNPGKWPGRPVGVQQKYPRFPDLPIQNTLFLILPFQAEIQEIKTSLALKCEQTRYFAHKIVQSDWREGPKIQRDRRTGKNKVVFCWCDAGISYRLLQTYRLCDSFVSKFSWMKQFSKSVVAFQRKRLKPASIAHWPTL